MFRAHLSNISILLDRWFRVLRPLNLKKLKFLGDYYMLYNLRFYYRHYRFLKMLHWQKRFSKKRKLKQITRLYKLNLFHYFINNLVKCGNKEKAFNIFFNFILLLKYQHKLSFIKILQQSLLNVKPLISFKVMYIGGKKYRIPVLLTHNKGYKLAIK